MTGTALPALGVRLPNSGPFAEADHIFDVADVVDRHGFDRLWVHDHISWARDKLTHFATGSIEACGDQDPNFFESVTTVAMLLGRFPRIGVGIAGLVLPIRDPRILMKQLTTVDRLGGSRLIAALAIGNIRGDFEVMGTPFERRGRLSTDHLGAMRAMVAEDQPVAYESDSVSFTDGTFFPRPRGLRLWVTASSEAGLRRVAALGDGWLTVYHSVAEYAAFAEQLRAFAAEAGREPGSIDMGYETYVCIGRDHDDAVRIARRSLEGKFATLERGMDVCLIGGPDEILERIAAYRDAGARHIELKFIAHDVSMLKDMIGRTADAAGLARPEEPQPAA